MVKGVIVGKPRSYPMFAGSLPSTKGGRRSLVLAGVDPDGNWDIQKEDAGAEYGNNAPILFVPFGGIDYGLTKGEVKEMLAGMNEKHQKWRDEQPPIPDLTKRMKEFYSVLLHYQKGRKHFAVGGIKSG